MSKYTAEQVESHIACLEARDMHAEAGMLRDYAALLRERESAKAGVTDEMVFKACDQIWVGRERESNMPRMRRALEAVVPMLASARVPDVDQELQFRAGMAFEKGITRRVLHDRPGLMGENDFCKFMLWLEEERQCHPEYRALATAPKPETEE